MSGSMARAGVVVSALLALGALGAMLFQAAVPLVGGPRIDEYWGVRLLPPGPGEDGLPLIPVVVNAKGELEGDPAYLAWYGYCNPSAPGLQEKENVDNVFRFWTRPEKLEIAELRGDDLWYEDRIEAPMRVDDYGALGQGAPGRWRSEGLTDTGQFLSVLVVRVDPMSYPEPVRSEFVKDGFLAVFSGSTHFCCVVGYGEDDNPRARRDGREMFFDPCHDQTFDPVQVVKYPTPPGVERV